MHMVGLEGLSGCTIYLVLLPILNAIPISYGNE